MRSYTIRLDLKWVHLFVRFLFSPLCSVFSFTNLVIDLLCARSYVFWLNIWLVYHARLRTTALEQFYIPFLSIQHTSPFYAIHCLHSVEGTPNGFCVCFISLSGIECPLNILDQMHFISLDCI